MKKISILIIGFIIFACSSSDDSGNPNNDNNGNNNVIKYEVFTNGNGGQYVILKYILNKTGDTLTSLDRNKKYHVYVKEKIPSNWKRYQSNW